jgi:hypothetical protein
VKRAEHNYWEARLSRGNSGKRESVWDGAKSWVTRRVVMETRCHVRGLGGAAWILAVASFNAMTCYTRVIFLSSGLT